MPLRRGGFVGDRGLPLLVTGMPRAGTTWLARLLATAPGTALAGREPMNPRGRQYALGGSLKGWSTLTDPSPRQVRRLRGAYLGRNPMVYSRYGRRQWRAALPGTRLVVKDPFALLALPTVVRATGARPIVLYRHPGAALVSYRRVGWAPDIAELAPIVERMLRQGPTPEFAGFAAPPVERDEAADMAWFWNALHAIFLAGHVEGGDAVVVAHEELAGGGTELARRLFSVLGLQWSTASEEELAGPREAAAVRVDPARLHNLSRAPREAASGWRGHLSQEELSLLEAATEGVRDRLEAVRLRP